MPLPAELQQVADELADLYREAQANLTARLAAVIDEPNEVRQRVRLREMIRTLDATRKALEAGTREWLTTSLPELHAAGAVAGAEAAGTAFAWTAPHAEAVQALAEQVWGDVAPHLQQMTTNTRQALRMLARDAGREVLLEGRSSTAAGRRIEHWMVDNGIGTVTYRNGAQHLAADYADTLSRTVTANAYNEGTFTQAAEDGFEWMEVYDGPDCGWTRHDDADKANGTVRTLQDCRDHSLSHPRCARSFSPRPDVATPAQAEKARRFSPEDSAAMAAEERARDLASPTTLTGRARNTRESRAQRAPRTPRRARAASQPTAL